VKHEQQLQPGLLQHGVPIMYIIRVWIPYRAGHGDDDESERLAMT
jgi:hypothetical protein